MPEGALLPGGLPSGPDVLTGAREPESVVERAGRGRPAWGRFLRHRLAVGGLVLLVVIALAVMLAGVISPYGYEELGPGEELRGPNGTHLFGTDSIGRDQLSRVLHGGRISLAVGAGVALLSGFIGAAVGAASGYFGGRLDNFLMRATDLFLAIPLLVLLMLMARGFGRSVFSIILVLSLFFWMPLARIVRGVFLSLREREFVEAARALGASSRRIILRHLLPNAMGPIIVTVTLSVATAILSESVLSFLGFGVRPPTPTWGNMLADSGDLATTAPWLVWFPGLAILLTVLAVNFVGDGLRDALDPSQRRVRR